MFASNQVLEVSGDMSQLESALRLAVGLEGTKEDRLCFQITEDGKFCIGWGAYEGWKKFQFDFDYEIVSKLIRNHIEKRPRKKSCYDHADGSTGVGFIMKAIDQSFADEENGIINPFYGIVSFEQYINYYAK